MANTPVEVVDLGGDVCLLVGSEGQQVRLNVSHALLFFASPYFRTLFGPHFMQRSEADTGKNIELQDDGPGAFTVLCQILHMRYDFNGPALSPDQIFEFAVVTDKYGCVGSVAFALKSIFPNEPAASMSFIEVGKLASAAYLLDHAELFQRFTKCFTCHFTDDFLDFLALSADRGMPGLAWGDS